MNAVVHRGRPAGGAPIRTRPRLLSTAVPVATASMATLVDLVVLAVRSGIGVVLIAVGWYEASGRLTVRAQAPWLTLAIVGAGLTIAAQVGWVLRLRRAVSTRIASVIERVPSVGASRPVTAGESYVCIAGSDTRLYHRAGCALTAGRPLTAASVEEHRLQRRIPCEVCEP